MKVNRKHTKGEWSVKRYGYEHYVILNSDGHEVCSARNIGDAELIATAPKLLEALVNLRKCIMETRGTDAYQAVSDADDIIGKLIKVGGLS